MFTADAIATQWSLGSLKSTSVLCFWYRLTPRLHGKETIKRLKFKTEKKRVYRQPKPVFLF